MKLLNLLEDAVSIRETLLRLTDLADDVLQDVRLKLDGSLIAMSWVSKSYSGVHYTAEVTIDSSGINIIRYEHDPEVTDDVIPLDETRCVWRIAKKASSWRLWAPNGVLSDGDGHYEARTLEDVLKRLVEQELIVEN